MNPKPGEIYFADVGGKYRPVVVVSREELNRGHYVVVVPFTSQRFSLRRNLPNCVAFQRGQFGLDRDCVAQAEQITFVDKAVMDWGTGPIGKLDEKAMREIVKAIGDVISADCQPHGTP